MNAETIHVDEMPSPVGRLLLLADAQGLREIRFETERHPRPVSPHWLRSSAALAFAREQLEKYFAGTRTGFDLPLHPQGTAFQQAVWQALLRIPRGGTTSYGRLGADIGKPAAVRAVGAAVGRNPISVVVPCHRVLGSDGSLTGYAGGLDRKIRLLQLEGASHS